MAFEIPSGSWFGDFFWGESAKKYNKAIEDQQVKNINAVLEAGDEAQNVWKQYTADSEAFAKSALGGKYLKEIEKTNTAMQKEKANALGRAAMKGADISSAANFAQTEIERSRQGALYDRQNQLEGEALQKKLGASNAKVQSANQAYYMLSGMGKKDESSAFGGFLKDGLGILSSGIPFFGGKK